MENDRAARKPAKIKSLPRFQLKKRARCAIVTTIAQRAQR
jgi:hypothetical protein